MLLHSAWNSMGADFLATYVLVQVPIFLLAVMVKANTTPSTGPSKCFRAKSGSVSSPRDLANLLDHRRLIFGGEQGIVQPRGGPRHRPKN